MNIIDSSEILNKINGENVNVVEKNNFITNATPLKYFKFNENDEYAVVYANPEYEDSIPETVVIPSIYNNKTVAGIAVEGFSEIENMRKVVIGEGMRAIGNKAFLSCKDLVKVVIYTKSVPKLGRAVFTGTNNELLIYVLQSMVQSFKSDESWKNYENRIRAIDESDIPNVPEIAENNGCVNVIVPTIVNSNHISIINNFYFNTSEDISDYKETDSVIIMPEEN